MSGSGSSSLAGGEKENHAWALKWSENDNPHMIGMRIHALLNLRMEIPADMRAFAERAGVDFTVQQNF